MIFQSLKLPLTLQKSEISCENALKLIERDVSIITDKHTKFFKKQTVLMGAFESMFATGSQAQIQTSNKTVFPCNYMLCAF